MSPAESGPPYCPIMRDESRPFGLLVMRARRAMSALKSDGLDIGASVWCFVEGKEVKERALVRGCKLESLLLLWSMWKLQQCLDEVERVTLDWGCPNNCASRCHGHDRHGNQPTGAGRCL